MFVSKAKYTEEQIRRITSEIQYLELRVKWNTLVDKHNTLIDHVNSQGGEAFLNGKAASFTKEEVNTLLRLCHPDKHKGKKSANDITTRLIMVRNTL